MKPKAYRQSALPVSPACTGSSNAMKAPAEQPPEVSLLLLSPTQAGILEDLAAGGRLTVNTGGGSNFLHAGERSRDVREPTLGKLRKLRTLQQVERQYPILTFGISKRGEKLLEEYHAAAKKKREKGASDR